MSSVTDFTTLPKSLLGIALDYVDLFPTKELISHHTQLPVTWPKIDFIWSAVARAFGDAQSLGNFLKLEEYMDKRLRKFAMTTFDVRSNVGGIVPIIKCAICLTQNVAFEESSKNKPVAGIFAVLMRLELVGDKQTLLLTMVNRGSSTVWYQAPDKQKVKLDQSQVCCTEEQPISQTWGFETEI